ncbi:MAG: hypothetical protein AABW90_03345 [Nanoarchaeota archaeon]
MTYNKLYDGIRSYLSVKDYTSSFDYSNFDSRSSLYSRINSVDKLEYKDFCSGDNLLSFN